MSKRPIQFGKLETRSGTLRHLLEKPIPMFACHLIRDRTLASVPRRVQPVPQRATPNEVELRHAPRERSVSSACRRISSIRVARQPEGAPRGDEQLELEGRRASRTCAGMGRVDHSVPSVDAVEALSDRLKHFGVPTRDDGKAVASMTRGAT